MRLSKEAFNKGVDDILTLKPVRRVFGLFFYRYYRCGKQVSTDKSRLLNHCDCATTTTHPTNQDSHGTDQQQERQEGTDG